MGTPVDWNAWAARAQATERNVPSPCVSVCAMDETSGLCRGCWRRLEEIAAWSTMADEGKRAVWAAIAQRTKETP